MYRATALCFVGFLAGTIFLLDSPPLTTRTFPDVPITKLAEWQRPRAAIEGKVTLVKKEDDGDWHLRIEADGKFAVCEIIPEMPIAPPKVGQQVRIWGIVRYDKKHDWPEIHPVVGWK